MDINITLFGELITFSILCLVIVKGLWPRFMKLLEVRQQKIQEGLDNFERSQQILVEVEKETQQQLKAIKEQASLILDQAHQQASMVLEEARKKAVAQKKAILSEAVEEIKFKVKQQEERIRTQEINFLMAALENILAGRLDKDTQIQLIEQAIERF